MMSEDGGTAARGGVNESAARLEATRQALREWDPERVVPCHCTGEAAVGALRAGLGDRVRTGFAGLEWIA